MHEGDADSLFQETLVPAKLIQPSNTDFGLFDYFKKALDDTAGKKFILIHTMGSHFDYSARYFDAYDHFQPSLKTVFANPNDYSSREVLFNSYDNSILFSDSFIDSVIQMVNEVHVLSSVFYIADHGENLFDDGRHLSLHAEVTPSIYAAHVPFFIWYSDSLKKAFPDKIGWLVKHKDNKTAAENVFPTLTDICNIHFALQDSSKCIDEKSFTDSRQRLIGSGMAVFSYDSIPKF